MTRSQESRAKVKFLRRTVILIGKLGHLLLLSAGYALVLQELRRCDYCSPSTGDVFLPSLERM